MTRAADRVVSAVVLPLLSACAADAASSAGEQGAEWVAFSSNRSGQGDIYAVQPATGEVVRIAGTNLPEGSLRFDPARERLVYDRFYEDEGRAAVVADGDELFDDPTGEVGPAWSPAGDAIAYPLERDGRTDLYVAGPDGGGERRLTDDPDVDRYPAWSPDGGRIAFARQLADGWELFLAEDVGGPGAPTLRRLTRRGAYVGHVSWSPDGARLAFDTRFDDHADIAVLDIATGAVTRVTDRPGNDLVPAWSADGRTIAFAGEPAGSGNWDIWTVDVETLEIARLTNDPAFDGGPVFVPAAVVAPGLRP